MAYEVVLLGRAEGALRATLSNRLGEEAISDDNGALKLLIRDKSALMALLEQLHDLQLVAVAVECRFHRMRIDRSLAERQRRGENFDEGRFHSRPAIVLIQIALQGFRRGNVPGE